MAVAALKIKALPNSPELNFDEVKEKIKESLKEAGAIKVNSIEEELLAFGLKALIITISWPEQLPTEKAEEACQVEGISSVQIIDYRRAFG